MNGHSQEFLNSMLQEEQYSNDWMQMGLELEEEYRAWLNDPVAQSEYQEWNNGQIRNR